jgi:7-carboxy-7-deazaguanine synthase
MKICEIFTSIQGESTYAGLPCTFIRLTGCNLRCSYCDTQYAYAEGSDRSLEDIMDCVNKSGLNLVEITGGEPLLQGNETLELIRMLLDKGHKVLIETNGSESIKDIDERAVIIMDIKTPSSNMSEKMDFSNLDFIKNTDEVKFVICSREDYEWSKNIISSYRLAGKCELLLSPAFNVLEPSLLSGWIIEDRLDVRLNLQIHKYIFGPGERGV